MGGEEGLLCSGGYMAIAAVLWWQVVGAVVLVVQSRDMGACYRMSRPG